MYGLISDWERAFISGNRRLWGADSLHAGRPRVSLNDTDAAVILTLELPGFRESDVSVTLEHDKLTISGKRRSEAPEGAKPLRLERGDLGFSQVFALNAPVDADAIVATFKEGLLTVTVPKRPAAQPRQIPVNWS